MISFIVLTAGDQEAVDETRRSIADQHVSDHEILECDARSGVAVRTAAIAEARGDFVAFVDGGDTVHPAAVGEIADATREPSVDLVYTDEDHIAAGWHSDPFLKPAWSPERIAAQHYTGRLTAYRRSLALEACAAATSNQWAFEHDLTLRVGEIARSVQHVERVLYHRTDHPGGVEIDDDTRKENLAVVDAHLARRHAQLRADFGDVPGTYRLLPALRGTPLVSIVIPTAGSSRRVHGQTIDLVNNCVRSIVERTTYPEYEIVCVADTSVAPATLEALRTTAGERLRVVNWSQPFNFSEKINVGVSKARGDYLLLLNDDTEIVTPMWLEALTAFAADPQIGAVGPRLCFGDGRLQHVGVVMSHGNPGHPFYGYSSTTRGYFGTPHVVANYLAVTAACLMTRRDCFEAVGGLSPLFPNNYNDIDFCLKLHRRGLRTVFTPEVTLFHYESSSRGASPVPDAELVQLADRWEGELRADPYYSPRFMPGADFLTWVTPDGRPLDDSIVR